MVFQRKNCESPANRIALEGGGFARSSASYASTCFSNFSASAGDWASETSDANAPSKKRK
jgi:hypothetical protein